MTREENSRTRRVGDQIQRQLALLIQKELKDPRVSMVTITGVVVSREFEHARVYFTVLNNTKDNIKSTLEGLTKASGFLRKALSHGLTLRTTPQLHFVYDSTIEDGNRLVSIIEKANIADSHK